MMCAMLCVISAGAGAFLARKAINHPGTITEKARSVWAALRARK